MKLPPHLALLNRYLIEVAAGRIARLLVFMPPRHGKSTTISQWFPAWYLGHFPDRRFILASHGANFAKSWGRKARDILMEYGPAMFGTTVSKSLQAADEWGIEGYEGGMLTAGVGGSLLGRGADILVIDDVTKSPLEAESQTIQQRNIDWFHSVALTRLEPGGAVVILMTRWSRGDLAGKLLEEMEDPDYDDDDGEPWVIIKLPALAEEGDLLGREPGAALWPERWPVARLESKRERMSNFWWECVYQQNPLAARGAGGKFARHWFETVDRFPAGCKRYVRYWDLAATTPRFGLDPDWTAGALMAELNGYFYMQVVRTQGRPHEVESFIRNTAQEDGKGVEIVMEQEPGSTGTIVIDHYGREVFKGWQFKGDRRTGDVELNINILSSAAEPLAGEEFGRIRLVRGGHSKAFLDEAEEYPAGAHDDTLVAAAGAIVALTSDKDNHVFQPMVIQRAGGNTNRSFGGRFPVLWRPGGSRAGAGRQ